MDTKESCPRCGAPLEKAGEPCPRCLLELGRLPPEAPPASGATSAPRAKRRADPPIEELAKRFPELEIAARIGAGGMGAVYKARQPRIDRWVALKILSLDPGDPTFAERFRREAVVLARLDHPNIVKLYDFGERDGLFFLLLEYVDGPNLRTLMKQGLLEPKVALAVVPQMCEALQFAHDEGIVHRDIKPENVLLDAKGRVKIADFGLAKLVDADARDVSLTEVDQIVGTPHYMAPEQLRGSREVDHRADIYSLGVVFYEMLTGELPRGNFELPSRRVQVDVRLDEIVLKSLERTPELRYQHAVEVKTDVESVETETPRARSEGPALVAGISIYRRRRAHGRSKLVVHPNRPREFFVTYLVVWPLVGLAWNGGPWWFGAAMALVAGMFWSQIEHAILARPELAAALAAEPRRKRFLRHLAALLLLAAGLGSLFLGHVAILPSLAPGYRSPAAALLDGGSSGFRPTSTWVLDHEKLWTSAYLLLLAPVLLAAAVRAMMSKHSSYWPAAASVGALFGSLALVESCTFVAASAGYGSGPLVPVLDRKQVPAPANEGLDDLSRLLRIALVRQDYVITMSGTWEESTPSSEVKAVSEIAEPASPFDRWRMSWSGPHRKLPQAMFMLERMRSGPPAKLMCSLGEVRPGSDFRRTASEWLERTLALAAKTD